MSRRFQFLTVLLVVLTTLEGCVKGTKYAKPQVQIPASYKEVTPDNFKETDNWKFARPADDVIRGKRARRTSQHLKPEYRAGRGELSFRARSGQAVAFTVFPDCDN